MKFRNMGLCCVLVLALLCALACTTEGNADGQTSVNTDAKAIVEIFTSGDCKCLVLQKGTVTIVEYTGSAEELTVPAELNGMPVTSIGDGAFDRCDSLTSITLPDSIASVGSNPFSQCWNLQKINVSPEHPTLAVIDGVLFSKVDNRLICYPMALEQTTYVVPQGVKCIDYGAFAGCESLTSITLPDSVTSIGDFAFVSCFSLTSITLSNSVTNIGDVAFGGCHSLTSITLPDSVTSIGDRAFSWCISLTSITLPDSLTSIGDDAFSWCPNLTLTVPRGSYAEQYAQRNNLTYIYSDTYD
ncbi:MAG: leucine-rich repeat domain-containing protein [Aristaeellaceae bacterium]